MLRVFVFYQGISSFIESITESKILTKICSNLSPSKLTTATFEIPVSAMDYGGLPGYEVCERICELYEWACDDPFRAVTHNKGSFTYLKVL